MLSINLSSRLLPLLPDQTGNLVIGPQNILQNLMLVSLGAAGSTKDQILTTIGDSKLTDHDLVAKLMFNLDRSFVVGVHSLAANQLFAQTELIFMPQFLRFMHKVAGFAEVDFKRDPERAREIINGWAKEMTEFLITEGLPPGSISHLTRLVTCSVDYFKVPWASKFLHSKTFLEDFNLTTSETVQVAMMHQTTLAGVFENPVARTLRLDFIGDDFCFVAILPNRGYDLTDVLLDLEAQILGAANAALQPVIISLPKFKANSGSLNLALPLMQIGMDNAFSGDKADFSAACTHPLVLDGLFHSCVLEINEFGGLGANFSAATSRSKGGPETFTVDRPFMYGIFDLKAQELRFLGQMMNPTL